MEPEERRDGASKDITDVLKQASQQLRIGEMIHGDDFELAKIMNAVEIGDRRLDAGILVCSYCKKSSRLCLRSWRYEVGAVLQL